LSGLSWQRDGEPNAPEAQRGGSNEPTPSVLSDLRGLLSSAVERLREVTGFEWAVAWARREDGRPYLVAAAFSGQPPVPPDEADFQAAATLRGATDLGEAGLPAALRDLGERHGCRAATPVAARRGEPTAILLLGGTRGPESDPVRPRTLAALDAAAQRLAAPLDAALAFGRLGKLNDEVCRLDRLAALGSLCAEIAHEVRNPLVSVRTFLQLLPERRDDPEFLTRFFEVVTDEVRRMERLLDLVIEYGGPGDGSSGAASAPVATVLDAVGDLLRHYAQARGVTLTCEAEADLPGVAVSQDGLRQVVLNLTLNAIDATAERGTVHLQGRAVERGVELIVADEGPGIPEALRARVFEPFFSGHSHRPGGLGLAITRRIVEEAGGSIAVADGASRGAEFRIRFPAV
jgi:signal transduction histidine kinase